MISERVESPPGKGASGHQKRKPMSSVTRGVAPRSLARRALQILPLTSVALAALAVGAAAAMAAPSPLPGYAYELVSPPATQGQRVGITGRTDDGNRVILYSPGGFAGTESLPDIGVHYETNRGANGWETKAIAPPASLYPYIGTYSALDFTEDLSKSLWAVNTNEDVGTKRFTAIVRQPDGTFQQVGPGLDDGTYTPAVIGTSRDLNRVVLLSKDRPPLTDGTIDARRTNRDSLMISERNPDGSLSISQVAYRAGATMFETCALRVGGPLSRGAVSPDADRIFFTTTGLSSCTRTDMERVWVKDGSAEPFDISAPECTTDCGLEERAYFQGAARDGSRAYLSTAQKLLDVDQDTSAKVDLYEYDFNGGTNKLRAVTASAAPDGAGFVRVTGLSEDGSRVYFVANGRPLAPANSRGEVPVPGSQNFYVYHREAGEASGEIIFIGALVAADGNLWGLGSSSSAGIQMTKDGRYAIFTSSANLTGDKEAGDNFPDIFHYDADSDLLRRVWTDDPDHNGTNRTAGSVGGGTTGASREVGFQRVWGSSSITADGMLVGFETEEPVSARDFNDQRDAYLWDARTEEMTLLTSGRALDRAWFGGMTPDAETIYVRTTWPLVDHFRNGSMATFALRRGGGFPGPVQPEPPCLGDGCQASASVAPGPRQVGSASFSGSGNLRLEGTASVRVSQRMALRGPVARLTVRVPGAGRVNARGRLIRPVARRTAKSGSYSMRLALKPRAKHRLNRGRGFRTGVRISFRSASGEVTSKGIRVTFRPSATAGKRGR